MPDSNVTQAFITDNLTQFKDKVNLIGEEVGGLARLTTSRDSNLVFAINELDSDIGARPHTTLTTTTKTLTGAINEIRAGGVALDNITADSSGKLGGFNDSAERVSITSALNTLSADVKTLDSDVGSSRAKTTLTTTSKNIVGSINELDAELGDSAITVETGVTVKRALNALDSNHDSAVSQLTTDIANSFRYTTISGDTGSDAVDSASGSLAIVGDTSLSTTVSGNRVVIDHSVTGATDVDNSGNTFVQDVTMDSAGHVTALASTAVAITNTDISAGAAINAEKIHDGTVSNTEFGYLNGVTSAIQTQIDAIIATVYPVGSVYLNYSSSTNPATLFGVGSWSLMYNRVIIGAGSSYGLNTTGGATTSSGSTSFTIASGNLPHHNHIWKKEDVVESSGNYSGLDYWYGNRQITFNTNGSNQYFFGDPDTQTAYTSNPNYNGVNSPSAISISISSSTIQPYWAVYMWYRTS